MSDETRSLANGRCNRPCSVAPSALDRLFYRIPRAPQSLHPRLTSRSASRLQSPIRRAPIRRHADSIGASPSVSTPSGNRTNTL